MSAQDFLLTKLFTYRDRYEKLKAERKTLRLDTHRLESLADEQFHELEQLRSELKLVKADAELFRRALTELEETVKQERHDRALKPHLRVHGISGCGIRVLPVLSVAHLGDCSEVRVEL